jgi:HKD family nuclease
MEVGLYEEVINKALSGINSDEFQVEKVKLDEEKAPKILSKYFSEVLQNGLKDLREDCKSIEDQINFCNYLISKVGNETNDNDYNNKLLDQNGEVLYSLTKKFNNVQSIKTMYPIRTNYSIAEPFIFTGANTDVQFLTEIKREISSCDSIDLIVSFIKWSGIVRIIDDLQTFTNNGGKLRVITTTYTGATEFKAIDRLSSLNNTQIKISYDTKTTRLHAKSYIFNRKTGFSTAYVGSSNISSAALTSGTEWNVKVVEDGMKEVFDKICGTFDTYWNDDKFELYKKRIVLNFKMHCLMKVTQ